ncbi:hypothetical protein CEK25_010558 [Fusarium fujikuroi]|nr:hypothetical protein CEK25_010558 [Fusarium fujikuroi]
MHYLYSYYNNLKDITIILGYYLVNYKLTKRFKHLDIDILNKLHSLYYTLKVATYRITLT